MQIAADTIRDHLKTHALAYALLGVIVALNIPSLVELVQDWYNDDNYSHGFLIIPISAYLFYRKRHELSFPSQKSTLGIIIFVAGCAGLILGFAAREYFTIRTSLVIVVTGFALYYLGWQNFKKVWFSFFFLLFMIPVPAVIYYSATLPMQLFASKVTVFLLDGIGVPVARAGNIIHLPQYTLEVAEACSGLRSLVTLLALTALYGYVFMPGKVLPVLIFFAAIPIAIATNVIRVFMTALGAHTISIELAEGFLHEMSGMFVFFTALILTVITGSILKWIRKRLVSSS